MLIYWAVDPTISIRSAPPVEARPAVSGTAPQTSRISMRPPQVVLLLAIPAGGTPQQGLQAATAASSEQGGLGA